MKPSLHRPHRIPPECFAILLGAMLVPVAAYPAWLPGGNPIGTGPSDQEGPRLLSDGAGGVFVVWNNPSPAAPLCGVQRMDPNGNALWGSAAVTVPLSSANPFLSVVSDQQGGLIVLAIQSEGYAQRVDGSGASQWGSGAVLFSTPALSVVSQYPAALAAGGSPPAADPFGVMCAWSEQVTSADAGNIYAQRLDDAGGAQWGPTMTPVAVCTATGMQAFPVICTDGTTPSSAQHGAYVAWQDQRSGASDVYVNRLANDGTPAWPDGNAVTNLGLLAADPIIDYFGNNSALVVWSDTRLGPPVTGIYAQKVLPDGSMAWGANGIPVCESTANSIVEFMMPFGAGGELISWYDTRSDPGDIYVQAIDASGTRLWGNSGRAVCTAADRQAVPQVVSDGAGGAFVIWYDRRSGHYDIYGQHLDSGGNALWAANGRLLAALYPAAGTNDAEVLADGTGGFYMAWQDRVPPPVTNYDIFVSRFNSSGDVLDAGSASTPAFRVALASANPTRGRAELALELPGERRVRAEVLDLEGRVVSVLVHGQSLSAGSHMLSWDGRTKSGSRAAAGLYFARVEAGPESRTLKLALVH